MTILCSECGNSMKPLASRDKFYVCNNILCLRVLRPVLVVMNFVVFDDMKEARNFPIEAFHDALFLMQDTYIKEFNEHRSSKENLKDEQ